MAERLALQRTAEMVDTAAKYAFHSKRSVLTVPDLHVAGGASGHGDAAAAMPQVLRVTDTVDLLCRAEAEVEATNALSVARLPAAPLEVGVTPHWLAINGVQPATVENAQPRRTAAPARGAAAPSPRPAAAQRQPQAGAAAEQQGEAAGGIVASLPLKHSMPEELHLYYDVVRRALQAKGGAHGCGPLPGHAVAASLATDPGLQPVLPYLVPLLAEEVSKNLGDARQLHTILSATRGLLSNANLNLIPYIHHLLPAILSCLVARKVGTGEDHWAVRDEAASLLALVARGSQQHRDELAAALTRVQKTLASSLFADALPTQYGSLVGLTAFGAPVLMTTVVPSLARFSDLFEEGKQTAATLQKPSCVE
ncbi:transcription initiation factor TFIID subunit 6-like isoform X1 [Micractinium conductrix]|uniref:Transcription initiation factor TFIID subunit 6-like isoform X1 n=1 Tax=Micractinium conductrix TaxID=554055 RepID=A0A2P6VL26_9CHLO|nr:transcription initiation factor TFIID subunit 6-like isoform X1 [Micractinium conductrix]|eukprot:PSC74770.1 transcription initiation factor TFIID subunit 6-like isoform X1 [Micractinium conductrix]